MPTNELTVDELTGLIDCASTSFAYMRRYLERHQRPYEPNPRGFLRVSGTYHDVRMNGAATAALTATGDLEPEFSMFH